MTESTTLLTERSMSREESFDFSQSVTTGSELGGIFGGVEVEVGFDQAITTQTTVSRTMECTSEVTRTTGCGDCLPEEGGRWFIQQWNMEQVQDVFGPGFQIQSRHFVCTSSLAMCLRCPLGFCVDADCQSCAAPSSNAVPASTTMAADRIG